MTRNSKWRLFISVAIPGAEVIIRAKYPSRAILLKALRKAERLIGSGELVRAEAWDWDVRERLQ